jgi:hypothetical protein
LLGAAGGLYLLVIGLVLFREVSLLRAEQRSEAGRPDRQ